MACERKRLPRAGVRSASSASARILATPLGQRWARRMHSHARVVGLPSGRVRP